MWGAERGRTWKGEGIGEQGWEREAKERAGLGGESVIWIWQGAGCNVGVLKTSTEIGQ